MKSKTLILIVLATAISASVVFLLVREQDSTQEQQKLFPNLAADAVNIANQMNELRLSQGEQTLRIQKDDNGIWRVVEKDDFPADVPKIRALLRALTEAEKIEEMSSRSEDFPKLGIADADALDGAGILLEMDTTDNRWQLIVGNFPAHLDQGQYIRLPVENRSWLINRRLELDMTVDEWLDKYIIHMPPESLHRIVIEKHDDELVSTMTIVRRTKDGEFEIENLPADREIKSPYALQQIAAAVDYLQFKEVFPKDNSFLLPETHIDATFTTFDGFELNMQSYQIDNESYAIFSAGYQADIASQYDTSSETEAEIQSDNEYLSELYANWYYKLLSPTYSSLDIKLDDLTTSKQESQ
ncbi:MAG: DUF4340 domain-containing protein [Chromatiales bacterium]|nr:DUF4340 domain-containing protein [Chromatiales bacterium]